MRLKGLIPSRNASQPEGAANTTKRRKSLKSAPNSRGSVDCSPSGRRGDLLSKRQSSRRSIRRLLSGKRNNIITEEERNIISAEAEEKQPKKAQAPVRSLRHPFSLRLSSKSLYSQQSDSSLATLKASNKVRAVGFGGPSSVSPNSAHTSDAKPQPKAQHNHTSFVDAKPPQLPLRRQSLSSTATSPTVSTTLSDFSSVQRSSQALNSCIVAAKAMARGDLYDDDSLAGTCVVAASKPTDTSPLMSQNSCSAFAAEDSYGRRRRRSSLFSIPDCVEINFSEECKLNEHDPTAAGDRAQSVDDGSSLGWSAGQPNGGFAVKMTSRRDSLGSVPGVVDIDGFVCNRRRSSVFSDLCTDDNNDDSCNIPQRSDGLHAEEVQTCFPLEPQGRLLVATHPHAHCARRRSSFCSAPDTAEMISSSGEHQEPPGKIRNLNSRVERYDPGDSSRPNSSPNRNHSPPGYSTTISTDGSNENTDTDTQISREQTSSQGLMPENFSSSLHPFSTERHRQASILDRLQTMDHRNMISASEVSVSPGLDVSEPTGGDSNSVSALLPRLTRNNEMTNPFLGELNILATTATRAPGLRRISCPSSQHVGRTREQRLLPTPMLRPTLHLLLDSSSGTTTMMLDGQPIRSSTDMFQPQPQPVQANSSIFSSCVGVPSDSKAPCVPKNGIARRQSTASSGTNRPFTVPTPSMRRSSISENISSALGHMTERDQSRAKVGRSQAFVAYNNIGCGTVGPTPLYHAVSSGAPEQTIRTLINADPASTGHQDGAGMTPLHCGIEQYDTPISILELLIKANPRTSLIRNRKGQTPVDLLWKRFVDPDVYRSAKTRGAAAHLRKLMQGVVRDINDFTSQDFTTSKSTQDDINGEDIPRRQKASRRVRAIEALRCSVELREFWAIMTLFVKASSRCSDSPKPQQTWEDGERQIVHAAVAISCAPLLVLFAAALHPDQLREQEETNGRLPLHLAASAAPEDMTEGAACGGNVSALLMADSSTASFHDNNHKLPIALAAEKNHSWEGDIEELVKACPQSLITRDQESGMLPFMLAAIGENAILDSIYNLIRESPMEAPRAALFGWQGVCS